MKNIILRDRKLQLILLGGLLVQLITCIIQTGVFHYDQYFQIIDFSSYQLGNKSFATQIWELAAQIRPSIQIHFFSIFYRLCMFCNISNPYTQLLILRLIVGLISFSVFNIITIYYLRTYNKRVLYWALIMLNFSWLLPYTRTLYSSEIIASVLFFGAILIYDIRKTKKREFLFMLVTGFLLALAFFCRFQMAFALAGFGIWLVFAEKNIKRILLITAGFALGFGLNLLLDHDFYQQWVITPVRYFQVNIMEGKASEFGKSSFLRYIGTLLIQFIAPPFSLIFLFFAIKALIKKQATHLGLIVLLFILGHCIIAHKEDRFLFPIINIWPIFLAMGLPGLFSFYETTMIWIRNTLKAILALTLVINFALLTVFLTIPWSQSIDFSLKLKSYFNGSEATIYCMNEHPWNMGVLPMYFYMKDIENLNFKMMTSADSLLNIRDSNVYFATTFDNIAERINLPDSSGFIPVLYSSRISWKTNKVLRKYGKRPLADVWVLYKKK